jgi:hypothetical protein
MICFIYFAQIIQAPTKPKGEPMIPFVAMGWFHLVFVLVLLNIHEIYPKLKFGFRIIRKSPIEYTLSLAPMQVFGSPASALRHCSYSVCCTTEEGMVGRKTWEKVLGEFLCMFSLYPGCPLYTQKTNWLRFGNHPSSILINQLCVLREEMNKTRHRLHIF